MHGRLGCTVGAIEVLLIFEECIPLGNTAGMIRAGDECPTDASSEDGDGTDGVLDAVGDRSAGACGADSGMRFVHG